jgi:hypothetical protein
MVFQIPEQGLRIQTDYPHDVEEIEHFWIPLSDGTRLSARMWLPEGTEQIPVPAILEYIPYRKSDFTALRDHVRHPYFAGHGYASIRVDLRGSGESDGILMDEYLRLEQDDGLEVLKWIAAQPWCSGKVGIIGKSWGGFNGLQIAARRPAELKAIISLCSTDDRYADDVHYMGGCLLGSNMLSWASIMLAYNALPPDPMHFGEGWREAWLERIEKTPPYVEAWLTHQRRDRYWEHGSVCEQFGEIEVPVFAVGGWADGYTNAILRLLEGLSGPKKGLIGPWAHEYPEVAEPGPAIGFLQECLRWWDHWLKDQDTGMLDEPELMAWIQDYVPPSRDIRHRPGHWVGEPSWAARTTEDQVLDLTGGELQQNSRLAQPVKFRGHQAHGLQSGAWCPYGTPGDYPGDQRAEDALALIFNSEPAAEASEILGFPTLQATLSSDQPQALLAARLCDVAPDGQSLLVSWGLLNLTHRSSHADPEALVPGQPYPIELKLNAAGHHLRIGHHWRLSLSPTYWPHAWPSPVPVTLTLHHGSLSLPVRRPRPEDQDIQFGPPETGARMQTESLRPSERRWTTQLAEDGRWQLEDLHDDGGIRLLPGNIWFESVQSDEFLIDGEDPLSAETVSRLKVTLGRGDWQVHVKTESRMWADLTHFYVTNTLTASENGQLAAEKKRTFSVARDQV